MKTVVKRNLLCLICYCMIFSFAGRLDAQTLKKQDKQYAAEEVGNRIIQRFHETLDFSFIFKEFFVSSLEMRQEEAEMVFGHHLRSQSRSNIDNAAVERAYIAQWNFWHLISAHRFVEGKDFDLSPEIGRAYEAVTRTDITKFTSGKELDQQFNEKFERLNSLLRKNLSLEVFRSEKYNSNTASFKDKEETDIAQMRQDFGLGKDTDVYVVKRELFNYFLIEEEKGLKVFTISLRTKNRL